MLVYKITKNIDNKWSNYDKVVGECMLENYAMIFLDEYNCPIDDEDEVDYLYSNFKRDFS